MMNSPRKEMKVPLDVQEDVIENIRQIFPYPVNKELIRTILNNENWDLEKGLNFLHDSLKSFSKGNAPTDTQTDKKQQKFKSEKIVKEDKSKTFVKSASPVRTCDQRKPELFKKSPKPKNSLETGDWVLVNNPEPPNMSQNIENNESLRKNNKKIMIQNYDLIKLIGDTPIRIAAYLKQGIKVIILLRGCSGSGKSTYAKQFLEKEGAANVESHLFSTDNFFIDGNGLYKFNHDKLQEAHDWNKKLVKLAAQEGRSPIFVDNTNTRLWEMKEYAVIAVKYGYVLETLEPPTPWFFNEEVLFRKSRHSIPRESIRNMLDRYEANISGEDILKRFQLVYTLPNIPPKGTCAGLNHPMSKNHLKALKDLKIRAVKGNPTPTPRLAASSSKQPVNKSLISCASNETLTFNYPPKEINTGNKITTDLYNSSIMEAMKQLNLFDTCDSNQDQVVCEKSSIEANIVKDSSIDRESEENSSTSEHHKVIESNSSNNLEYVLVHENNDILFQKNHDTMEDIKTLEDFKNTSEVSFSSEKFDEFLARGIHGKEAAASLSVSENTDMNSSHFTVKELCLYSSNDHLQNPCPKSSQYLKSNIDSSTATADLDFAILEKVENGHQFLGQKIITGHPDFVSVHHSYSGRLPSSIITDDKSTMVPDVPLLPNASTPSPASRNVLVNTLQGLFPQVAYEKLNELFGQSSWEDLDWAVGLLLDTGEKMSQSNEICFNTKGEIIKDKIGNANTAENTESSLNNEIAGNFGGLLMPLISSSPQRKVNNTTMANDKRNFIGEWDYKNEMPSELPVEKPKLQRDEKSSYIYKPHCSASTNTNYIDFEVLKCANAGLNCEGTRILMGSPNFASIARSLMTFPSSSVHMLDKGTMTTDVQTNQIDIGVRDSGIERLCSMFPKVCRVNLEELFDKCQRDIDWAVGLLLDSGQEISELYTPSGTLNCSGTAEKQLPEVRDGEDTPNSDENKNKAQGKKKKKIRQSQSDSDVHKELQETMQKNFVFNEAHYSSDKMKRHFQRGDLKHNIKGDTNVSVNVEDDIVIEDEHSESDDVIFMLDSDFILQLQARFGGLLRANMLAEKNVVSLPLNLARQLHSYVMDSVSQHIEEEDLFEDEDEDYARHLQEEEYRNRDVPSLLKIMDEEVALRKSQKNLSNGGSIASALSKKLLIERFPKMDPSTLAAILDDTNNSLHHASTLLEAAGHYQPAPETNTHLSLENDGQPLLSREEAIKQADAYGDVAGQLYELRKDCLRKSQKAYITGNHSVASYYSDMAKWYMERIEKSNSLAAKAILSGYEGWTTIDLHFLHVSEALNILDLFIDEVIRVHKKSTVVYVITGRGIHSADGRSRLKPAVKSRLMRRGLKFSEQNPGMLKVHIPRNALTSYKQDIEDPS